MKVKKILLIFLLFSQFLNSQNLKIEDLGLRHFQYNFKNENVSVLFKSKKGDENIKKPLILYIQGSLARPLIINYPKNKNYKYVIAFPFETNQILEKFHIAVISKPYIPYLTNVENLDNDYCFQDTISKKAPLNFLKNDNLNYLTNRDIKILHYLKKLSFVNGKKIILLGHSEGSRVAFEIAKSKKIKISKLIYLSGNPFGRYINLALEKRRNQTISDLLKEDDIFDYWKTIQKNKNIDNYTDGGDTYKSTYIYSQPYDQDFLKLTIPVFIGYGTKDLVAPYNDLFFFYALNANKSNFYFKPYVGLEHSFYPVNDNGEVNYELEKFSLVISDVISWLNK
ncbi:hypothetical protein [Flavobacterium sp.]|uniref:hypothetical protein n=1 Tax=Flavobacterium sp. TaxID=239 RepID=UPI0040473AC5